ncbi:hypothetical protein A2U01_0085100, partial [Trifolium medium]|nr:hypothetical protein [Trifolium medium]
PARPASHSSSSEHVLTADRNFAGWSENALKAHRTLRFLSPSEQP